jgi:hypothetical protein
MTLPAGHVSVMLPPSVVVPHSVVTQAPALQTWPPPHATPHAPQLLGSSFGFDSQPLSSLPSQFANGATHGPMKHPVAHPLVAFG